MKVGDSVKFESSGYTKYGKVVVISNYKHGGEKFTLAIVNWGNRQEPVFADQLTVLTGEPLEV